MKVTIKRIDTTLPLPEIKTKGSIGFDLVARENTVIKAFEIKLIPLNVVVKTPKGYGLLLISRSSTPLKKGLQLANGVGVIDQDYCGEEDELKMQAYNFTDAPVTIERGERIAQAVFVKVAVPDFVEVESMNNLSRGGFGSTG